mgnify:FL=1
MVLKNRVDNINRKIINDCIISLCILFIYFIILKLFNKLTYKIQFNMISIVFTCIIFYNNTIKIDNGLLDKVKKNVWINVVYY